MFANTGNLSFYLGICFILLAFAGLIFVYYLIKKNSIEEGKLEKLIELGKWFIASVAIVIGATIISDGFKEREQDVKEMEIFDKYVTTITEADNIEKRWLLAEYFSVVAPAGEFRKSWDSYKIILKPSLEEYRANKAKLTDLSTKEQPTQSEIKEIAQLQKTTEVFEQSLVTTPNTEQRQNSEEWLIIAGTDTSIEAAKDELNKAKKISVDAKIYKKGNLFMTVIPNFSSKNDAFNRLPDMKKGVNSDAYIVSSSGWCRSVQDNGDYLTCN